MADDLDDILILGGIILAFESAAGGHTAIT